MNKQDRGVLSRMRLALGAIPGIRNPKDYLGHVTYYCDTAEARIYEQRILTAMLDRDPGYQEENQRTIQAALGELEGFIALRKSQDWQRPDGASPWKYPAYG